MITSTSNPRVKWIRTLQKKSSLREQEDAFIVEGRRLLQEANGVGTAARIVLHTAELDPVDRDLVEGQQDLGAAVEPVSDHVLKACSATETPQGVLAVLPRPHLAIPQRPGLVLLLDAVSDPGNLGTIMRTSRATGVDALFLLPGCVDVFNPKVVRAAAGAHFHLPVREIELEDLPRFAPDLPLWVADAGRGEVYHCIDWQPPAALAIGSEAHGANTRLQQAANGFARIPMHAGSESLNAGVAAAIFLFEIARQRGGPCKSEP